MYCLYMVLHAGIISLIIFLKPGLEPRLWAFSYGKPSPSPIQARQWAGLGWAQTGWAWVGFGLWARPSTSLRTGRNPREELGQYLTAPLEDVDDVVGWWGVCNLRHMLS